MVFGGKAAELGYAARAIPVRNPIRLGDALPSLPEVSS